MVYNKCPMKYAKKMQLVELESDCQNVQGLNSNSLPLDKIYAEPRVSLDTLMNEILNKSEVCDNDKWVLYNQTLQRYLNFMKNLKNSTTCRADEQSLKSPFDNNQLDNPSFSIHHPIGDLSGFEAIRDSLDSIQQPAVREFFEKIRENTGVRYQFRIYQLAAYHLTIA